MCVYIYIYMYMGLCHFLRHADSRYGLLRSLSEALLTLTLWNFFIPLHMPEDNYTQIICLLFFEPCNSYIFLTTVSF